MNQTLTKLLEKKHTQSVSAATLDWNERRDKYLSALSQLYKQIESMLAEPVSQRTVALRKFPKQLTENYIGTYSADDLILVIGDEQVRFSPRGRNIAGAAGRVDVVGERNEAVLLYQPDSGWAFVQTRQPALRMVPFDESTFAEVLQLVMRD